MTLAVKVQPKSRRPGLLGVVPDIDGARLRVGVAEAPEDGRANRAVCALLSRAIGAPARAVSVAHGTASRQKLVAIEGDPQAIVQQLEALCRQT